MPEESSPQGETFQPDAEQAEETGYCLSACCVSAVLPLEGFPPGFWDVGGLLGNLP